MKFKAIALTLVLAATGGISSLAVAGNGHGPGKGNTGHRAVRGMTTATPRH